MKRVLLSIFTIIIMFQLIGCSTNKEVEFKEFFSDIIGFSKIDEELIIQQDAIIMLTNEEFQKFKDEYFTSREIPMKSPDKEKAVLYLQIPSPTCSVQGYRVESINLGDNILTVNLKQSSGAQVDGIEGFDGTWEWVMLIEVDKTNLKDNMKIVVNK
ncbi:MULTISPECIES: hypothetical protein [Clostridium]|uniref:hypothetical protein n=1 Tax=Clostridium TaxID=1485 RepID=UPI000983D1E4|nr:MULTISPECIES: hypothetical protein [Clostridium]AQR95626.1 hypothetical protein CLSAP_29420 [Clostridium saccharoperbutylacetonicum]NSB31487.1 hypothetical protein [Clostridium saccharoperbutylacetonicum]